MRIRLGLLHFLGLPLDLLGAPPPSAHRTAAVTTAANNLAEQMQAEMRN